ncbi:MAG: glycosyltransferase [Sphingosinicella sp.]|uniref:glycosyltransferase n=1 Tax=Sphingosinicella sp. TaxID=1917971 RepID=UPI004037B711
MDILALVLGLVELTMREVALFAAFGFFLLGLSDLAVDLVWIVIAARRRLILGRLPTSCARSLAAPAAPGPIAVFVPAWDEAAVIGDMLRHSASAFGDADYRIYVGCYPNDPATIAAVRALEDARIRVVVGPTGIR